MAFYYGMNTDSSSSFINSMLGTSGSASQSIYNSLGDYAALKNGSYGKLVKAYYAQQSSDAKTEDSRKKIGQVELPVSVTQEQMNNTAIKNDANALKAAFGELTTKGSKSIFNKINVKDEETGLTGQEYDTDRIYKAVSQFVNTYNDLIKDSSKSTNSSISEKRESLTEYMNAYEKELKDMGIQIESDKTLTMDEKKFKESDMQTVKDVWNGTSALGAKMYQTSVELEHIAKSAVSADSLYTSNASYVSAAGSLFNSFT